MLLFFFFFSFGWHFSTESRLKLRNQVHLSVFFFLTKSRHTVGMLVLEIKVFCLLIDDLFRFVVWFHVTSSAAAVLWVFYIANRYGLYLVILVIVDQTRLKMMHVIRNCPEFCADCVCVWRCNGVSFEIYLIHNSKNTRFCLLFKNNLALAPVRERHHDTNVI